MGHEVPRRPRIAAEHADAGRSQGRAQDVVPAVVLLLHQFSGAVVDGVEDGGGAHAIRRRRQAELLRMAHGGGADLEELVEVGAGDGQEAQPFQQRHLFVQRLREYAEVEVQLR